MSYEIEAIRDKRVLRAGRTQYLIKWRGFPESDNTWEEEEQVKGKRRLMEQFNRDNEAKQEHPSSTRQASRARSRTRREEEEEEGGGSGGGRRGGEEEQSEATRTITRTSSVSRLTRSRKLDERKAAEETEQEQPVPPPAAELQQQEEEHAEPKQGEEEAAEEEEEESSASSRLTRGKSRRRTEFAYTEIQPSAILEKRTRTSKRLIEQGAEPSSSSSSTSSHSSLTTITTTVTRRTPSHTTTTITKQTSSTTSAGGAPPVTTSSTDVTTTTSDTPSAADEEALLAAERSLSALRRHATTSAVPTATTTAVTTSTTSSVVGPTTFVSSSLLSTTTAPSSTTTSSYTVTKSTTSYSSAGSRPIPPSLAETSLPRLPSLSSIGRQPSFTRKRSIDTIDLSKPVEFFANLFTTSGGDAASATTTTTAILTTTTTAAIPTASTTTVSSVSLPSLPSDVSTAYQRSAVPVTVTSSSTASPTKGKLARRVPRQAPQRELEPMTAPSVSTLPFASSTVVGAASAPPISTRTTIASSISAIPTPSLSPDEEIQQPSQYQRPAYLLPILVFTLLMHAVLMWLSVAQSLPSLHYQLVPSALSPSHSQLSWLVFVPISWFKFVIKFTHEHHLVALLSCPIFALCSVLIRLQCRRIYTKNDGESSTRSSTLHVYEFATVLTRFIHGACMIAFIAALYSQRRQLDTLGTVKAYALVQFGFVLSDVLLSMDVSMWLERGLMLTEVLSLGWAAVAIDSSSGVITVPASVAEYGITRHVIVAFCFVLAFKMVMDALKNASQLFASIERLVSRVLLWCYVGVTVGGLLWLSYLLFTERSYTFTKSLEPHHRIAVIVSSTVFALTSFLTYYLSSNKLIVNTAHRD